MTAEPESPKKVVSLRGAGPIEAEPAVHQEVVDELERMLQLAKDGQLVGLLVGEIYINGDMNTVYAGGMDTHKALAAAAILQHRVIMIEFEDDDC